MIAQPCVVPHYARHPAGHPPAQVWLQTQLPSEKKSTKNQINTKQKPKGTRQKEKLEKENIVRKKRLWLHAGLGSRSRSRLKKTRCRSRSRLEKKAGARADKNLAGSSALREDKKHKEIVL